MMLTDIKSRAAESWITDVMMSADRPFSCRPTTEPELPESVKMQIVQTVFQEAQMVAQQMPVFQEAVEQRMMELHDQVKEEIRKEATDRAKAMEDRIQDHLDESGFTDERNDLINDFCTYPTCFIAGPLIKKQRVQTWGQDWTPVVETRVVPRFERVSPYDMSRVPVRRE